MNSGVVGALALLAVGGALYLGSTFLGDYFSEPDGATQQVAGEDAGGQSDGDAAALALVPEASETAIDETAEAVTEAVDGAADAVTEAVESAVDAITETTEAATEEMAALSDEAAGDVLQSLGNDVPTEASEPGTTPVLDVVRVEPSGEVLIAGNAPEGERVGLVYNNEVVAEADVTEGGDFVLVPDAALPTGEGTLEVVVIDENGNRTSQSDEQVAVVLPEDGNQAGFLVGVLRPGQPVEIIEREAPEVDVASSAQPAIETSTPTAETSSAPEVETAARAEPTTPAETEGGDAPFVVVDAIELEGQEIWIAGAAPPGTIIRLYQDNVLLGETITGDEGRYLFEGQLSDAFGEVTVRADALATGSADVIARAEVPFDMPGTEMASQEMSTEDVIGEDTAPEDTAAEEAASDDMVSAETTETALADAVSEAADDMAESVRDTAETAGQAVTDVADNAAEAATTLAETAGETASAAVETVQEAVTDATEEAAEVANAVTSAETPASGDASPAAETAATSQAAQAETEVASTTTPTVSNERVSVLDTGRVIIRRGDNLWRLSRRVFGQGIRYTSIYDANRDQIRDPALIFPGQVFELPTPQEEWGAVPGVEALEPDQIPGPDDTQN